MDHLVRDMYISEAAALILLRGTAVRAATARAEMCSKV